MKKQNNKKEEGIKTIPEIQIAILEKRLDEHDCHLSPEDSCVCTGVKETIEELKKEKKETPQEEEMESEDNQVGTVAGTIEGLARHCFKEGVRVGTKNIVKKAILMAMVCFNFGIILGGLIIYFLLTI